MDKAIKFLSICILISTLSLSFALVYININDRYKVAGGRVFDMKEGQFVTETTTTKKAVAHTAAEEYTPIKERLANQTSSKK